MKLDRRALPLILVTVLLPTFVYSQTPATQPAVPRLVNVSGTALDAHGKVIRGVAGVTLSIYSAQYEGAPLFSETQNVAADGKGNFTAQLGITKPEGVPLDLFSNGEARWLGVRINGGEEQPRILLLSVPYALKAADAETIGGLPPSAFVRSTAPGTSAKDATSAATSHARSATPPPALTVTTTGGTLLTLPMFTTATNIQSSVITQTGSGASARIGIGVTTPVAALDVKGPTTVRGNLNLPTTGTATAAGGKNSQSQSFTASAFNSGTGTPVTQAFRWQAEPTGNNTASPSATLNMLYSAGTATPAETGLWMGSNGSFNAGTITGSTTSSTPGVTGNDHSSFGSGSAGVYGFSANGDAVDAYGLNGITGIAISGGGGDAGYFLGNVEVTDTLNATFKNFKIDHPLDPANQYLLHTSVESSEMMNIYTGNVTLDGSGQAEVVLPAWFESLNNDFRYQLTALGAPGPNLYVAQEISGGKFTIAGGQPGARVSWQITAIRHDAYAKAHPLVVEQPKSEKERGRYLHPELFGAPPEMNVTWAAHPRPKSPVASEMPRK